MKLTRRTIKAALVSAAMLIAGGADIELARVTLKAKKNVKFNINAVDGMLVDKHLNTVKF